MKKIYMILLALIAMYVASCEPEPYTGPLDSPVGNWEGTRSEYYFNGEKVAALDSCENTAISFYKQGLCCFEGVKGAFPYIYDNSQSLLQIDSTLWKVEQLTGAEMVISYLYRILPPAVPPVEPEVPEEPVEPENPEQPGEPEQPIDPENPGQPEEPVEPENPEGPEVPEEPVEPENPEQPGEPEEPGEPVEPEEPLEPENPEGPEVPGEPEEPVVKPDANGFILPIEYKGMYIDANQNGYYYINEADAVIYCNFKGWKNPDKTWTVDFWYDTHTDHFIPLVVEVTKK